MKKKKKQQQGRGHGRAGSKGGPPARSYRNSGRGRSAKAGGNRRDTGRQDGKGGADGRRGGDRYDRGLRDRPPPEPAHPPNPRDDHEFYARMRERLFAILGGRVCSGCGFRDERALGIASRYGDVRFDSVSRGSAVSSSWSRYVADPDLAVSELTVLCLNCNRIREPVVRREGDGQGGGRGRGRRYPEKPRKPFPR